MCSKESVFIGGADYMPNETNKNGTHVMSLLIVSSFVSARALFALDMNFSFAEIKMSEKSPSTDEMCRLRHPHRFHLFA